MYMCDHQAVVRHGNHSCQCPVQATGVAKQRTQGGPAQVYCTTMDSKGVAELCALKHMNVVFRRYSLQCTVDLIFTVPQQQALLR